MSIGPLSYAHIMAIADTWRDIGGTSEVEIGALEPLLWRDEQYRIHDVVSALTERGFKVSMTTNGQLLDIFAENLGRAGLSLIRTSWHSTSPIMFKEISGGYGDYDRFMRGVTLALESGIKVAFNRVLFKGYTDDLLEQLAFVGRHKSRLKLYTLMWTPQSAITHKMFYQDWRPVVRASVLPRTIEIVRVRKHIGRGRLRFHLVGGGSVEVKLGDTDAERLLATAPLRLTVTPFCNFNCRSPGATEGWCMEEPGEYIYPKIRPTLLRKG